MWLDQSMQANNAAEILNNAGRVNEAKRLLRVATYCYRRYENSLQMEAISRHRSHAWDDAMLIVGLAVTCLFTAAFAYCVFKATF